MPPQQSQGPEPTPERFKPPRATLLVDRFMTHFIKIGGISIVTAVFGIFLFILMQILPLFGEAKVHPEKTIPLSGGPFQILGIDEWGELPFVVDGAGKITFLSFSGEGLNDPGAFPFAEEKRPVLVRYRPELHRVIYGFDDATFSVVDIRYSTQFESEKRKVKGEFQAGKIYELGEKRSLLQDIDFGDSGTQKLVVAIQSVQGVPQVVAVKLSQSESMLGEGEVEITGSYNLTSKIGKTPVKVLVNSQAADIIVVTDEGDLFYFVNTGDDIQLRQMFQPFEDLQSPTVADAHFLFGGVSLVLTAPDGTNRVFSLFQQRGSDYRTFGKTKEFARLDGRSTFFAPSNRNKAFVIGSGSMASLRYATTEEIRWQEKLPFKVRQAIIGSKYNRIVFLGEDQKIYSYTLEDPHPEASFKALFGKIWYEGSSEPKYEWQSTGGTDDFEPKLSLIPLLIGTLKGTFYAMIFAVPVALLAAVYTSQFLNPNHRAVVKPTMEIMASLPSVVLGFLAALWLAPILETRIPSILLTITLLPAAAFSFGAIWTRLPVRVRIKIKPGYEWLALLPVLLVLGVLCWQGGFILEKFAFVITDPDKGARTADFRAWWTHVTGLPFEQRNSLVVGFMMGFAVIPIIFTITEDALSNVPPMLTSASLALGASRWQTAMRIAIPTASAGIFSAIMIGLGRAVGETMIVVMATGNTPIMDFNIFSGMRTLSANLAVELPEAPVNSTLYRTLFLGALSLFLMTFVLNTFAEILRRHLREKYKTV